MILFNDFLSSFFSVNYPNFYDRSKNICEFWLFDGTWVEESNRIGCMDFRFYGESTCLQRSIVSAGVVCETIGKIFICNEMGITCEG